jgi:cytochrome c553
MRTGPLVAVMLLATAGAVVAQGPAIPYAGADASAGRTLSQKDCVSCHARKFDGDATRIYTRPDRKVRNPEQLLAQVQLCNSELNLQYFPDDEANVAAYLDREHYRFSK